MHTNCLAAVALVSSGLACSVFADPPQHAGIPVARDIDGDGVITMEEFVCDMRERLSRGTMRDIDGDGVLSLEDVRENIVRFMAAMLGDLNYDGLVDVSDQAILLRNMGRTGDVMNWEGDVDVDGDIDTDDYLALNEVLGQDAGFDEEWAIKAVTTIVRYGEALCGDDEGDSPAGGGADDHYEYFSRTWPPDHDGYISNQYWPPNHDGVITGSWPPHPDEHTFGLSAHWPPNHSSASSQTWTNFDHETGASALWPPNHWYIVSDDWPEEHVGSLSRIWPPNHEVEQSDLEEDSDHHVSISGGWNHDETISMGRWPPNHARGASSTWTDHDEEVSSSWPAGHFQGPSATWGPDDNWWPANHFEAYSSTWREPPKPEPGTIWPPDHNWITTIIDGIDAIPL